MAHPSLSLSSSSPASGEDPRTSQMNRAEQSKSGSSEDPKQVVASLRVEIGQRLWDLDTSLRRVAETAQTLTGANGAAIAIRREGAIVCQARAGEMAPALGTKLNADSGISGECLRTARAVRCDDTTKDARVDPEVREQLGLWSLAAVPLAEKRSVIGILEVFSALPCSFSLQHLELLEELGELVIAVRRGSTERVGEAASEQSLRSQMAAWIPDVSDAASVRLRDRFKRWSEEVRETLVPALRTESGRRKLVSFGVAAMAVSLGLGWLLGYSEPTKTLSGRKTAETPRPVRTISPGVSSTLVWNSNTATVSASQNAKPTPSSAVVMASKREKADAATGALPNPELDTYVRRANAPDKPVEKATSPVGSDAAAEGAPGLTMARSNSENLLDGVLSAPMSLPAQAIRVSEGVTEGTVVRRVQPIYPAQARTMRLEGSVVLQAVVAEDGSVHQVKLISGPTILARAAENALSQWRYRPFRLNGKPIPMTTEIRMDFKLPAQ